MDSLGRKADGKCFFLSIINVSFFLVLRALEINMSSARGLTEFRQLLTSLWKIYAQTQRNFAFVTASLKFVNTTRNARLE